MTTNATSGPVLHVHGAKGGVGTTTAAVLFAVRLAAQGNRVRVLADTLDGVADLRCVANVLDGPIVFGPEGGPAATVVDHGVARSWSAQPGERVVLVLRNDYLSLRRGLGLARDVALLISEPGRALTVDDARDVLGGEVVEMRADPAVARAVDAGLLSSVSRAGHGVVDALIRGGSDHPKAAK